MDCAEMGESEERAGIRRVSRDSTGAVRMPIWNTTIMCLAFFWGLCRVSALPGLSSLTVTPANTGSGRVSFWLKMCPHLTYSTTSRTAKAPTHAAIAHRARY
jgi:hypothetical protein